MNMTSRPFISCLFFIAKFVTIEVSESLYLPDNYFSFTDSHTFKSSEIKVTELKYLKTMTRAQAYQYAGFMQDCEEECRTTTPSI
jgi:hypothetical protein